MIVSPNPYQSPVSTPESLAAPYIVDGVPVHAHCSRRSWFGRTIDLTGGIVAQVRYNAAGSGEKVFVNDTHVASSSPWHLSVVVAPRIDFQIDSGDTSVPATVYVYASWLQLFRVIRFSLILDGTIVYKEPDRISKSSTVATGSASTDG